MNAMNAMNMLRETTKHLPDKDGWQWLSDNHLASASAETSSGSGLVKAICQNERPELIFWLLNNGALPTINTGPSHCRTPLYWATRNNNLTIEIMLLLHGAKPSCKRHATIQFAKQFYMEHERYIQFVLSFYSSTATVRRKEAFVVLKNYRLLKGFLYSWTVPNDIKVCIKDLL